MGRLIFLVFAVAFINCFMLIKNENKANKTEESTLIFSNFKYSGKLIDAGVEETILDSSIIRRVKLLKFESDKYR